MVLDFKFFAHYYSLDIDSVMLWVVLAFLGLFLRGAVVLLLMAGGEARGGPGVPVTPLCKPCFKQTTYNRW